MTRATFILITLLLAFPCPSPGQETHPDGTINQTVNGLRQGRWEIKGANDCIEAGEFKNGRKNGVWLTRTAGGTMISEITYTSGMAKGPAKIYYPNGSLMESGVWNVDHWEGAYTRYHENGKVMYDGEWSDGKITGTISVYDETGKKIGERNYDAQGKFSGNTKIAAPDSSHGNAPKYNKMDKTGNLTIFDSSGRKEQSGQFENGKLINGERYVYDKAGKLIRTDKVRNGRVETSINR